MREKYTRKNVPRERLGDRTMSLRKGQVQVGRRIADTLGTRVDVYYDKETNVLSFSRGDSLGVYKMTKASESPCISIAGVRKEFDIKFEGRLEATWNEDHQSWDALLPQNSHPQRVPW